MLVFQNPVFDGWSHFEELKLEGDFSDFSRIWSKSEPVGEFDNSDNYFVANYELKCSATFKCNQTKENPNTFCKRA